MNQKPMHAGRPDLGLYDDNSSSSIVNKLKMMEGSQYRNQDKKE